MTEPNALLLGVLREIGRDILAGVLEAVSPQLEDISARLARLEAADGAKGDTAQVVELLQSIEQNLVALGRLGGEIHGRVAADAALPRDLLAQPVMAQFCDHYPTHVARAVDPEKFAAIVADIQSLPIEEITKRRDALADAQGDSAFDRYQLREVDAAIEGGLERRRQALER